MGLTTLEKQKRELVLDGLRCRLRDVESRRSRWLMLPNLTDEQEGLLRSIDGQSTAARIYVESKCRQHNFDERVRRALLALTMCDYYFRRVADQGEPYETREG